MDKLYMKVRTPDEVLHYDREIFSRYIDILKDSIKRDASPGVPYSISFRSNGQMLDSLGSYFNTLVLNRIECIMLWDGYFNERKDLIEQNLMDPVRLFVKNEPHAIEKCQMGRFRLIMSVSLVDKMVEMVFNHHTNKQQIMNWDKIPSKPGMGFTKLMASKIYDSCKARGIHTLAAADVSGWDWSVKEWLLKAETTYRLRLQSKASEFYTHMMFMKSILDANSVYQFSDGELVQCDFSGLQNSGKYNTSSGNSIMRIIVAFLVGSDWGFAMGDDCIETYIPNAQQAYLELGFRCKMYDRIQDSFEFCSHIFTPTGCYALNVNKSLMRLLQNDSLSLIEKKLLTMQFEDDIEDSPCYSDAMECLVRVGWYAKLCQTRKH